MSNSMPNPLSALQDQYLALAQQSQEFAKQGQNVAYTTIDQLFDFALKVIDVQRNLSKQLVSQSAALAENVAAENVAQRTASASDETAEKVTRATRRTSKSAQSPKSAQSRKSAQSPKSAQSLKSA